MECTHEDVTCINEYEDIRKYRCAHCDNLMMCACDEPYARQFFPHQIREGVELKTQRRIPVTLGFQPRLCRECRGLPQESHPRAEIFGCTSKIKRYYWREIARRKAELFASWSEARDPDSIDPFSDQANAARELASKTALDEIKVLHATNPKYSFAVESDANLILRYEVEVVRLNGIYARQAECQKARVLWDGIPVSVEQFVANHYREQGFDATFLESKPFHVLFGVFLWMLIEDPADELGRIASIRRDAAGYCGREVFLQLPEDFGTPGYGLRRKSEIDEHFSEMIDKNDLLWLFDLWIHDSERLRLYLWAFLEPEILVARKLIEVLPAPVLKQVLRYLIDSYWERYLGWPDLVVHRNTEFFFVEVKSSNDKLSDVQRHWMANNHQMLRIPFKIAKVHKSA